MAAAVFLHNAIFAADPPSPPTPSAYGAHAHHRSSGTAPPSGSRRPPPLHDRQLSSVSSITLHASTSECSHPTESLIHPESTESSVYLGLLARQPTHPSVTDARRDSAVSGLSLQGDPVTPRERRVLHERTVRRRLRRLRLVQRVLWVIIGGWATYNTVRYYVSAGLHSYYKRQVLAFILGSCTAFSVACDVISLAITASAPHLDWHYKLRSKRILFKAFLHYASSLSLLAPAIVNLIFVILWRNSSEKINSLRGRCGWDIDVVWSGLGGLCDRGPAWGFWLSGALVRLILTGAVLVAYHAVSYKYMVTRRPSRRRHTGSIFRHSAASFPSPSTTTTMTSSPSFRPMATVDSARPVSFAAMDSQSSLPRNRSGSLNDSSESPTLRSSRSRIGAGDVSPNVNKVIRRAVSAQGLRSVAAHQEAGMRSSSPSSSEGDTDEDGEHRYGRPVRRTVSSGGYTSIPLSGSPPRGEGGSPGPSSWDPVPDSELNDFAAHFRALVEQVTRETDEAVSTGTSSRTNSSSGTTTHHLDTMQYDFPMSYNRDCEGQYGAHIVLGRTIHRMPTIESLGSNEVMSIASAGINSRQSTRSNTLSTQSRSASRSNSLDAAVSLSIQVDGLAAMGAGTGTGVGVGEMGELVQTPTSAGSTGLSSAPTLFGSRSTGTSYYTARSAYMDGAEEV